MKITKTQLKQIIKEELNEQAGYDHGAREYFQSLSPPVQAALNAEFGEGVFIGILARGFEMAAYGGSKQGEGWQALDIFNEEMSKKVFGEHRSGWFHGE